MASGKSLTMGYISRDKPIEPREHPTPNRDRSLNGKKRRDKKKAEQRATKQLAVTTAT